MLLSLFVKFSDSSGVGVLVPHAGGGGDDIYGLYRYVPL